MSAQRPRLTVGEALPATQIDREWELQARKAQLEALPRARATAEKWAAGLGTMLTLTGIATLSKGPSELGFVQRDSGTIKILTAAALALGILALLCAIAAAQGRIGGLDLPTGARYREWSRGQVDRVRLLLAASMVLASVAVSLVAVAIAIGLFGRHIDPAASQIRAVTRGGEIYCGSLVADGPREVTLLEPTRTIVRLPMATVVRLVPVERCP